MRGAIRLTVHARVRYAERCLHIPLARMAGAAGIDPSNDGLVWRWAVEAGVVDANAVGRALTTPHINAALACGAKSVDLGNGCKAVLQDGHIITVISKVVGAQRGKADRMGRISKRDDRLLSRGFHDRKWRARCDDHA